MKYLYVWEGDDVLTDYTNGLICAIADSLEDAYRVIERDDGLATYQHEGEERVFNFPKHPTTIVPLDSPQSMAFTCWGGG